MKLIAIIAMAAMAVGLYTAAEATPISSAKETVICEQQNNGVVTCNACFGKGTYGNGACWKCKGRGIMRANGSPL